MPMITELLAAIFIRVAKIMHPNMDTITIDDLPENANDIINLDDENSNDVVEVTDIQDYRKSGRYDDIIRENKLMGEFICHCMEMENSDGIRRVINHLLIPAYERTTKEFRQSGAFKTIITRALCNLHEFPHFRFTHIKELCDSLKFNYTRKSWKLARCVPSGEPKASKRKRRKKLFSSIKQRKQNKNIPEIILTDDSDEYEVPVINLVDIQENSTVENVSLIVNNEKSGTKSYSLSDEVQELVEVETAVIDNEKENDSGNVKTGVDIRNSEKNYKKIDEIKNDVSSISAACLSDEDIIEVTNIDKNNKAKHSNHKIDVKIVDENNVCNSGMDTNDVNMLLLPYKECLPLEEQMKEIDRKTFTIQKIEREIAVYKGFVAELEVKEVEDNSQRSPYILCESYKTKIVKLYRKLCNLTGESPVKRRKVHLNAMGDRPQLPMKKLEEFINNNIGDDGHPPFPDFCDVMQCVKDANDCGKYGWGKNEIMNEAIILFKSCGRALQKSRQKREWRFMLNLVKTELVEDPADADPELMARLQANRQQAITKERDLMDRYLQVSFHESDEDEPPSFADNIANDNHHKQPSQPDNSNTSVNRITPISVFTHTSLPNKKTHHVNRVVNKRNQIVELVVSREKESKSTDSPCHITNAEKSNIITADDNHQQKLLSHQLLNNTATTEITNSLQCNNLTTTAICTPNLLCHNTDITGIRAPYLTLNNTATSGTNALNPLCNNNAAIERVTILPNTATIANQGLTLLPNSNIFQNQTTNLLFVQMDKNNLKAFIENQTNLLNQNKDSTQNQPLKNTIQPHEQSGKHEVQECGPKISSAKSLCQNLQLHHTNAANSGIMTTQESNLTEVEEKNITSIVALKEQNLSNPRYDVFSSDCTEPDETHVKLEVTSSTVDKNHTACQLADETLTNSVKSEIVLDISVKEENELQEFTDLAPKNDEDNNPQNDVTKTGEPETEIKEEKWVDIQKELDDLGSDFTMTILDILDTNIVVEVSSDSSSEDEDAEEV